MNALQELEQILAQAQQATAVEDLLLFNTDNGIVLAAATNGDIDKETLGSLASGAGTALAMMCRQFAEDEIAYQIIKTDTMQFIFYQIDGARYLLSRGDVRKKAGYVRMMLKKHAPAIKELLLKFDEANSISFEGADADDIIAMLDNQMDSIFGGGN